MVDESSHFAEKLQSLNIPLKQTLDELSMYPSLFHESTIQTALAERLLIVADVDKIGIRIFNKSLTESKNSILSSFSETIWRDGRVLSFLEEIAKSAPDALLMGFLKEWIIDSLQETKEPILFYSVFKNRECIWKNADILRTIRSNSEGLDNSFLDLYYHSLSDMIHMIHDNKDLMHSPEVLDALGKAIQCTQEPEKDYPDLASFPDLKYHPRIWRWIGSAKDCAAFYFLTEYFGLEFFITEKNTKYQSIEDAQHALKQGIAKLGWDVMRAGLVQEYSENEWMFKDREMSKADLDASRVRLFRLFRIEDSLEFLGDIRDIFLQVDYDGDFEKLCRLIKERLERLL